MCAGVVDSVHCEKSMISQVPQIEVHRGSTCFTVSVFSVDKKVEIYFQVGSLSFNC